MNDYPDLGLVDESIMSLLLGHRIELCGGYHMARTKALVLALACMRGPAPL